MHDRKNIPEADDALLPLAELPDARAVPELGTVVADAAEVVEEPCPLQLKPTAQQTASLSELVVQYWPDEQRAPDSLQQTKEVGS